MKLSVLMKPMLIIVVVLIAFGVGALAYQGITYASRPQISDIGPSETTHNARKTVCSPMLGGVGRSGGVVLVILGVAA